MSWVVMSKRGRAQNAGFSIMLLAAYLFFCVSPASSQIRETGTSGHWTTHEGRANTGNRVCSLSTFVGNARSVVIRQYEGDDFFTIDLSNFNWSFIQPFVVRLAIRLGRDVWRLEGNAIPPRRNESGTGNLPATVEVARPQQGANEFWEAFRLSNEGSIDFLRVDEGSWRLSLLGSNAAASRFLNCVSRLGAVASSPNQSPSLEDAKRWCERIDPIIPRDTQIAGCTFVIRSGQETPRNLAIAFNNRGHARAAEGDRSAAISDYSEAVRLNPQFTLAFYNRGLALAEQGDRNSAIINLSEAIRLDPQHSGALTTRGLLQHRAGQLAAARADIETAIRIASPGTGAPFAARAGLALLRGDYDIARTDLDEALRRNGDDTLGLALRAILRGKQGDTDGAAADAAAVRRKWPSIADLLASLFGPELVLP